MDQKPGRPQDPALPPDELPYRIELCHPDGRRDRLLGRALTAPLARAIFQAAIDEHPGRRIVLRKGDNIILESSH